MAQSSWFLAIGACLPLVACGGRAKSVEATASGGAPGAAGTTAADAGSNPTGGLGGAASAEPPAPVDPAISRAWSWAACGSLRPEGADRAALFDASGNVVVLGPSGVRVYRATAESELVTEEEAADFLVAAPDGSVLRGRNRATGISLSATSGGAPETTLPQAPTDDCGTRFTLSADGDYLVSSGDGKTCAWRLADATFAGSVTADQATVHNAAFVVIERSPEGTDFVVRDFQGSELSRRKLGDGPALLSPAGDRAIFADSLVDLDTGRVVAWDRAPTAQLQSPLFSPRGEMVWVGNGVFRTSDGKRQFDIDPTSRLATEGSAWAVLAADGSRVVSSPRGRATLFNVEDEGITAVLGLPPLPGSDQTPGTSDLAISGDGSLLLQNIQGFSAFGITVTPSFSQSKVLWHMTVEVSLSVDVSADGHFAAVGGDGHAVYDGRDGRRIWGPSAPPPGIPPLQDICLLDRLRISPRGTWIADSDYSGKLQVFDLAASPSAAWQPLLALDGHCEAPAFSRDEKLMATSAASLYSTAPNPKDWKQLWSTPLPAAVSEDGYAARDVRFSPDDTQLLVSRCALGTGCATSLIDVKTGAVVRTLPELDGPHPAFSPEGSWLVAAGKLLHLPSGEVRRLVPDTTAISRAIFIPDGDIIAGSKDGTLTRFCRAE